VVPICIIIWLGTADGMCCIGVNPMGLYHYLLCTWIRFLRRESVICRGCLQAELGA